ERATLLGYENFADFKLADSMAGTPAKARALLEEVWEPARKRALEESDALQALITREGNNSNFSKSDPSLLSFDDAVTLFHEMGHALHGLLSQVQFPRLSGTNVARD